MQIAVRCPSVQHGLMVGQIYWSIGHVYFEINCAEYCTQSYCQLTTHLFTNKANVNPDVISIVVTFKL